ncbi:Histidine kinase CKI1 [Forsythia ovata]|uniref:histidine kinase n=1 Tax=Forsythia ovata TaxID=205694 RepID=A0ABD1VD21_9LAMI
MKLSSFIVLRPVCLFTVLMFMVLLLPGLIIPFWIRIKRIENEVNLISYNINQQLFSGLLENTASLFASINASTINLARSLSSSLERNELQFAKIESKVASTLFLALSTIPDLSQISYISLNGLFFAYYTRGDQLFGVFSNSTFSSTRNDTRKYCWYTQAASRDTGKLYGESIKFPHPDVVNSSWFQEALNSMNGYTSIGSQWDNSQDFLFLSTAVMDGKGVVSLGFPVKSLIYSFTGIAFYNGSLYLAREDGSVLTGGIPNTRMIFNGNQVSFQLLSPNGDQVGTVGNVACQAVDGTIGASTLSIWEKKYVINCSPVEIARLKLVYVLALPENYLALLIHQNIKFAFVLLRLMLVAMAIMIFIFVLFTVRAARREMHLCVALIKQKESTEQAERKNMNKSLAFASASHDVRASLAGLTGLIEICHYQVVPGSELQTNLIQMEVCAKDLLGILNSILDASKIEAGKMQLEEEEFDLEQLLENVVDLYYPVGMKKGVDVVLDPNDGSVTKKFSRVKGDRGKLKQILCNLLSNAVKFTSDGHVTVRTWARKPSFENEILASNHYTWMNCILCLFSRIDKAHSESGVVNTIRQDPNCMEYVFEVNDTGKGIPKEKQKSVFENYVQVKETALGQEGTGLGLGIVQSLVRLMGGEIGIVDKEVGERGTCFRFNAFFSTCNETGISGNAREDDIEVQGGSISSDSYQYSGSITRIHSPKAEVSQVVIFIQSNERSQIIQKFMERQGIKAYAVKQHEQLSETLKRIKQKLNLSHQSSSGKSDVNSLRASSNRSKDVPLSSLDGTDNVPPLQRRTSCRGFSSFVLIVIDTGAGPFRDISRAVAEFRRDLSNNCCSRVVWLDKPGTNRINFHGLDEDKLPAMDLIISKPLHGSRLKQIIGLLPEFGGAIQGMPLRRGENTCNSEYSTSAAANKTHTGQIAGKSSSENIPSRMGEIEELDIPSKLYRVSGLSPEFAPRGGENTYSAENMPGQICPESSTSAKANTSQNRAMTEKISGESLPLQKGEGSSSKKPLTGKKILVADDDPIGRKIATSFASQLGANTYSCVNGEQALEAVCNGLKDQYITGASKISVPFDYILMDCEMPLMNGIEATRRIREAEGNYGVHTNIIALTAHERGEEINKMIDAGVDDFLTKPLTKQNLFKLLSAAITKEQIVDIDAADVNNDLAVVEYVEEIYKFYKLVENDSRAHDYMDSQPEINEKMRAILVDWLIQVHHKFELLPETLYLTINIVDRYLAAKKTSRRELQLLGISSMLIASKYEEIWALEVNDLVCISDRAYTNEKVLRMEKRILGELEWNSSDTIYVPSTVHQSFFT